MVDSKAAVSSKPVVKPGSTPRRCHWAQSDVMIAYHDAEWGVPLHDDRGIFEFLILEGHQAGLSWEIILRKREAYRAAFDGFDPARVEKYDAKKIRGLLRNAGLVRNKLKMRAAVDNARAFLEVQREFGSFDKFLWQFVNGTPLVNHRRGGRGIPATTPESDALSVALKKTRLPICRFDDLLCDDAGSWNG